MDVITLATLGLSLVVIAWIEQLFRVLWKKRLSFSPFFLAVYIVGVGIIAADRFYIAEWSSGALNVVIALLAFIILVALIYRRKKPGAF